MNCVKCIWKKERWRWLTLTSNTVKQCWGGLIGTHVCCWCVCLRMYVSFYGCAGWGGRCVCLCARMSCVYVSLYVCACIYVYVCVYKCVRVVCSVWMCVCINTQSQSDLLLPLHHPFSLLHQFINVFPLCSLITKSAPLFCYVNFYLHLYYYPLTSSPLLLPPLLPL